MSVLFSWALIAAGIRLAVPVALAALGSVVSERSGVLNLGLEGMMLSGALSAYLVTLHSGSPWVGLLGGTLTGALCGCILAFLVVSIRANQIVTGIAFTLLCSAHSCSGCAMPRSCVCRGPTPRFLTRCSSRCRTS